MPNTATIDDVKSMYLKALDLNVKALQSTEMEALKPRVLTTTSENDKKM